MRTAFLFTSLLALLLISGQYTRAAETNVITLSCDGTFTNSDTRPEPVGTVDIVVNFDERTVYFLGYLARMEVDTTYIHFNLERFVGVRFGVFLMDGYINRVTGHMTATTFRATDPSDVHAVTSHYDLLCKVTNRRVGAPALPHG
jgi:hypothetical protein